jgi:hypothetical protein
MTRATLGRLWMANLGAIVALSFMGRSLQRLAAGAASREVRAGVTAGVLFAVLAAAIGLLRRHQGSAATVRASALGPLLALGLWLVPLPEEQVHFLVFGVFGALTFALFDRPRAVAIAFAVAIADELLQGALPERVFDVRDIIVNSASAVAGGWALRGV